MLFPEILLLLWGGIAGINLVRGLSSGSMRCFYAYRAADASRNERPGRYWTYAAVNLFIATLSALLIWAIAVGGRG